MSVFLKFDNQECKSILTIEHECSTLEFGDFQILINYVIYLYDMAYIGQYLEGKNACLKAISTEDKEVDMNNLLWYLNGVNSAVVHPELVALSSDKGELFRPEDINTDAKMPEKDVLKKG